MKKLMAAMIALALLCIAPAFAEASLADAAAALEGAASLDERLSTLYDLSVSYAGELENGGWDVNLRLDAMDDDALSALIPDVTDAEEADGLPEALADARFIVVHDRFDKDSALTERWLLGGFQVRLPEANRARSASEANAVLYVKEWLDKRGDYIGEAYNRVYTLYAARLDDSGVWELGRAATTPPYSGMGVLSGDRLSAEELWLRFGSLFYNTELYHTDGKGEGGAYFRVTGSGCCLTELIGDFEPVYEVPAEVEGVPVTGIESMMASEIHELVLPEGLTYISGNNAVYLVNLEAIHFPSTLRRVTGEDVFGKTELKELAFNEGLEEIGEGAIPGGGNYLERVILPSTLKSLGNDFLTHGLRGTWVALPEGLKRVPSGFLTGTGAVECVFLPASIEDFGINVMNSDNSTRVYAPEGSVAAAWAVENGKPYIPCASADDMPKPEIETEGDFTYTVVEGEAMLMKYNGADADVVVPDELGGCPVTVIKKNAFYELEALETLRFPATLRLLELFSISSCEALQGVYVPGSPENVHFSFLSTYTCPDAKVYAPADSTIAAIPEVYEVPWVEWDPEA